MKILLASFNQKLGINPMVSRLFDALPEIERAGVHDCEAVFLSWIAPESDFVPDKLLLDAVSRRRLPVIIFDHTETFPENHIFPWMHLPQESNYKILESVVENCMDTRAYFKRELPSSATAYQSTFAFPIFPLDWTLNNIPGLSAPVDTEAQYHDRPIDIFMSFGYSNESRPRLMGELIKQAGMFNGHIALTEEDLDRALSEGRERIFALLFTPHFRRIHISKLVAWQQKSKVAISLFGAGKKSFRHSEASYNSVMAHEAPEQLQWSYPWKHGENCIGLPPIMATKFGSEDAVTQLYSLLRIHQGSLYPIYRAGIANNAHYHNSIYARQYLLPKIVEALK